MTYVFSLLAIAALVALDQYVKYLAVVNLAPIREYPLWDGVFKLAYVENTGAAFGLLENGRVIFIILTVVVLGLLVFYYIKLPKTKQTRLFRAVLTVLFAGAIGNFIDRARQGYVVDMFYFHWFEFPVFNVADILLVCSTLFICVMILLPKVFGTDFVFGEDKKTAVAESEAVEADTIEAVETAQEEKEAGDDAGTDTD